MGAGILKYLLSEIERRYRATTPAPATALQALSVIGAVVAPLGLKAGVGQLNPETGEITLINVGAITTVLSPSGGITVTRDATGEVLLTLP